jgi:hypothetical protein
MVIRSAAWISALAAAGLRRVMALLPHVFLIAVIFAGCGQREYSGPQRFPLSGKVTYDGEPVDAGSISFLPLSGTELRVSGGTIEGGAYSVPEPQGANAGKYRVEIRWQKRTGKKIRDPQSMEMVDQRAEGLPAKFHKDSELTAEVSAGQTKFDFDLKSQ